MREQITQNKTSIDEVFRAQDAEMRQLQQVLTEIEAQARRAETTTTDCVREAATLLGTRLGERTEIMLDTAARHFGDVFDGVKAAVEGLDWKVQGHTNEIW